MLLDESAPRRLAAEFAESFLARPVQQTGWAGCSNEELLRLAADHGFGVLVTVDQGFAYQQSVRSLPISVVIMIAGRTRLQELLPLVPAVVAVLSGSESTASWPDLDAARPRVRNLGAGP